jgi:hypothetical protein
MEGHAWNVMLSAPRPRLSSTKTKVVQQDCLTRTRTFTSNTKHSINFNTMLEVRQILLSLQEIDLEVREVMLVEEQALNLYSFDEWDLSVELEENRMRVTRVEDEHTAKAGELSTLVMEALNALVDLRMLPIQDIP